jgi:uncharacterized protein
MDHDLPAAVTSALSRYRAELDAMLGSRVREFVLFGSHARGEAHEESDVDVLVVVDNLTDAERREAIGLAYDVDSTGEWVGLSPLVYSTAQAEDLRSRERLLMREIDRDGIRT